MFSFACPTAVPDELQQNFQSAAKDIMWKYIVLKENMLDSLKKLHSESHETNAIASYLEKVANLRLKDAQGSVYYITDICTFIEDQSSFYDYEILKSAIQCAGTEHDKQCLEYYERDFREYSTRSICACPSTFGSLRRLPSDYGRIKVTLDWSPFETLETVKRFHQQMILKLRLNTPLIGNYKLLKIQLHGARYVTLYFSAPAEFQPLFRQRGQWLVNVVDQASDAVVQLCIIPFY